MSKSDRNRLAISRDLGAFGKSQKGGRKSIVLCILYPITKEGNCLPGPSDGRERQAARRPVGEQERDTAEERRTLTTGPISAYPIFCSLLRSHPKPRLDQTSAGGEGIDSTRARNTTRLQHLHCTLTLWAWSTGPLRFLGADNLLLLGLCRIGSAAPRGRLRRYASVWRNILPRRCRRLLHA